MKAEPHTSLNYFAFTNHKLEQQQPIIREGRSKKVEAPGTIVPIVQYIVALE
jgi:hypothetical protein